MFIILKLCNCVTVVEIITISRNILQFTNVNLVILVMYNCMNIFEFIISRNILQFTKVNLAILEMGNCVTVFECIIISQCILQFTNVDLFFMCIVNHGVQHVPGGITHKKTKQHNWL